MGRYSRKLTENGKEVKESLRKLGNIKKKMKIGRKRQKWKTAVNYYFFFSKVEIQLHEQNWIAKCKLFNTKNLVSVIFSKH